MPCAHAANQEPIPQPDPHTNRPASSCAMRAQKIRRPDYKRVPRWQTGIQHMPVSRHRRQGESRRSRGQPLVHQPVARHVGLESNMQIYETGARHSPLPTRLTRIGKRLRGAGGERPCGSDDSFYRDDHFLVRGWRTTNLQGRFFPQICASLSWSCVPDFTGRTRRIMRLPTQRALRCLILCLSVGCIVTWGQTFQGSFTGTVMDPTGAVIPGALVTITADVHL
jgi:hypothetical protein